MLDEVKVVEPTIPAAEFRVSGAGDPRAIQRTLDVCAAAGGGRVIVPAGAWPTGPLTLSGRTELHLESGATLEFSSDPRDYLPVVFTRWEGIECYNYHPLIYARDCADLALTGSGTLRGNGAAWWHWKELQHVAAKKLYDAEADGIPPEDRVFGTERDALRPQFIQFVNCRNILISGVRIEDGPQWTIHPVYCENVIIRGVTVDTVGPNTDGLNPDSCRNVLIEDCDFATGDDCIAINSGMNEDGWRVGRPCENVLIRRCRMTRGHGGVVIGSGMSGGVRNITVHDCRIDGTELGIRLKAMRGRGGVVEDIAFHDLQVDGILGEVIQITTFYGATTIEPRSQEPPHFRNIRLENISGSGAVGIQLRGLPEAKLRDISLRRIRIAAVDAMQCADVENLILDGVDVPVR